MIKVLKQEDSKTDKLVDQRAQEQAVDASVNGRGDEAPALSKA
jgi:hypothetical protein